MTTGDGLYELTEEVCRAKVANHPLRIGRIAFLDGGYPVVLPINYRMLDGQVVFRTGLGSKLDAILRGTPVSFQVDWVDTTWQDGWSVLIKGKAEELTGAELARAEKLPLRSWAPGRKPRFVVIRAEHTTGRQIT